jgi:DNA-binding NtrC family response regulator
MPVVLRAGAGEAPEKREPLGRADVPYHEAKEALLARFDREYMTDLLARAGQNISQAARIAGIERKHLYKVLERAGLREKSAGGEDEEG